MKTLSKILSAGLMVLLLFSCDKSDEITVEKNSPEYSFYGNASLVKEETVISTNFPVIEMVIDVHGTGDLGELGYSTVELSHIKIQNVDQGEIQIEDGQLTIRNQYGSEINGSYQFRMSEDVKNYTVMANITNGTDNFSGARGIIQIEFRPWPNGELHAAVKGDMYNVDLCACPCTPVKSNF